MTKSFIFYRLPSMGLIDINRQVTQGLIIEFHLPNEQRI